MVVTHALTLLGGLFMVTALRLSDTDKDTVSQPGNLSTTTQFKNVLLVIHCRPHGRLAEHSKSVCKNREHLYAGYRRHFNKVIFLGGEECEPRGNDAYRCAAEIMSKNKDTGDYNSPDYDGLFYMRADTLIRVDQIRKILDKKAIATYGKDNKCKVNRDMTLNNCNWINWNEGRAGHYKDALHELSTTKFRKFLKDDTVWLGNDDLYYIPKKFWSDFVFLSNKFAANEVHHFIAGPTIRALILAKNADSNSRSMNLHCDEECCDSYKPEIQLKKSFNCGHFGNLKPAWEESNNMILAKFLTNVNVSTPSGPQPAAVEGFLPDVEVTTKLVDALTA